MQLIKFGANFTVRRIADALELAVAGIRLSHSTMTAAARIRMRTYYFDMKDGIPTRDRKGLEFPNAAGAIEHSKELARLLRQEPRLQDPALAIVVVDESGNEVHREQVYPDEARLGISRTKIG